MRYLCAFFEWFWFKKSNRLDQQHRTKIVKVIGPSTFYVDRYGSRSRVSLRAEGCFGYEYHRQVFILLGEWLRRWRWFRRWDRDRCSKCGHDQFKTNYFDTIESVLCEETKICSKCNAVMYEFSYGAEASFVTTKWERYEIKIFGIARDH